MSHSFYIFSIKVRSLYCYWKQFFFTFLCNEISRIFWWNSTNVFVRFTWRRSIKIFFLFLHLKQDRCLVKQNKMMIEIIRRKPMHIELITTCISPLVFSLSSAVGLFFFCANLGYQHQLSVIHCNQWIVWHPVRPCTRDNNFNTDLRPYKNAASQIQGYPGSGILFVNAHTQPVLWWSWCSFVFFRHTDFSICVN